MEQKVINPSVVLKNYLENKPKLVSAAFELYLYWDGDVEPSEGTNLSANYSDEDFSIFINKVDFDIPMLHNRDFAFYLVFDNGKGTITWIDNRLGDSFNVKGKRRDINH